MLYIGLFREKHENIFLSETTRPGAMIFGMKHYLVVLKLYPWRQRWPHPGGHMLYIGLSREKHEKIFLSETIRRRAMIFGI